jgi:predicted DCC family thiol-disulfide oxidoreductase YuxK
VEDKNIILFDGVCNFCNSSINFVIDRDTNNRFVFAPLQEPAGSKLLKQYHLPASNFDSVVLIKNGKVYKKSSAALEIARHLDGIWPLLYVFKIVPGFIRDTVYDVIAKNRYKWFGRTDACRLPTPELRAKFL